jgi:hypothetical protein
MVAAAWPRAPVIVTPIPAIKEGHPGPVELPAIRPASRVPPSPDPKIKIHYAGPAAIPRRRPLSVNDQG